MARVSGRREPDDAADFIRDYGELRRRFGTGSRRRRDRPRSQPSQLVHRDEAAWIGEIPVDGFGEPGFEALVAFQPSTLSACEGSIA